MATAGTERKIRLWVRNAAGSDYEITKYHIGHEVEQKLNALWTFNLHLVGISETDKTTWIKENHQIILYWGTKVLMKGRIERITYSNYVECKVEGVGMAVLLRDRDISETYTNIDSDTVVENIVSENTDGSPPWLMTIDTNTNYGLVSMHFSSDNKLKALGGTAQGIDYDWWEDWKAGDDYATNYINVDDFKGDPSTTIATFRSTGSNANIDVISQKVDTYETANYVTTLGYGDGLNQAKAISFNATDNRTTLNKQLDARVATAIQPGDGNFEVYDDDGIDAGDVIQINAETKTVVGTPVGNIVNVSGTFSQAHDIGSDVIRKGTNDYIYCVDHSSLPASGDVWIGQEKIAYASKASGNRLRMAANGRGQDYLNGRSSKPYYHGKGIEVYDAQYTSDSPESGSYIDNDGVRSRTFTDVAVIDQNMLDYLAQRIRIDRQDDVAVITVKATAAYDLLSVTGLEVGDWVELEDTYTGFTPGVRYEVVSVIFGFNTQDGEYCKLDISNYNRTLLENTIKETDNLGKYYKGATNLYQVNDHDNCGTGYPLEIPYYIPSDAVAINKVLVSYDVTQYRSYSSTTGAGSAHQHTLSIGASGSHDHEINGQSTDDSGWVPDVLSVNCDYTDDVRGGFYIDTGYQEMMEFESNHPATPAYDSVGATCSMRSYDDMRGTGDLMICRIRLYNDTENDEIDTEVPEYWGRDYESWYCYGMAHFVFAASEEAEFSGSEIWWEIRTLSSSYDGTYDFMFVANCVGIFDHDHDITGATTESSTHTHPGQATSSESAHTHGVNYGISEAGGTATDIRIEIDDGNGYVDRTAAIEAIYGTLSTTREQDIDITQWVGRNTGWKGVRIEPTGNCRIRGDIYIKTFVQST